jgi:hypothetical protein
MATDYCIRRLLPSVAFLTWRVATERSINQKQNEQFEDEKQRQQEELHLMVTKSTKKPGTRDCGTETKKTGTRDCGTETIEASNNSQNQPVQMLPQTSNSRTVERDSVRSFERDNVSPNSPLRPDGQHQTLSQLASFLMPAALDQALTRSPFLDTHQASPKIPLAEILPQNSSLLDLQAKLSRLETRWASIRLNPS